MTETETLIGGSLDPVVGRTVEELETDCRIWEQNARGVLAKLKDERAKNRNLMKLIWAIVLKHGGETRLNDFERGILHDDWELLEYTDMETLALVIKARSAPNNQGEPQPPTTGVADGKNV